MVLNLKHPSSNQASKVSATMRTRAKDAYDRIMEAMASEDSSSSSSSSSGETSEVKMESEVELKDITITIKRVKISK
eukprot:2897760-Amphidinium_carterae.1